MDLTLLHLDVYDTRSGLWNPEHGAIQIPDGWEFLADQIANAAATRASEVGSGRVGRTSTLTLAQKAELAARAHIRHHHTNYEDQLASTALDGYGPFADDDRYLDARANARPSCQYGMPAASTVGPSSACPLRYPMTSAT